MTKDGRSLCRICVSEYRSEVEQLLFIPNKKRTDIARKYAPLFKCSERQFYQSLKTHVNNRHAASKAVVLTPEKGQRMANIESFAQKLLNIGEQMIDERPEKVTLKDVVAAQKLVLEKQKLKLGETELMLKMAEMFGGIKDPKPLEKEEDERLLGGNTQ